MSYGVVPSRHIVGSVTCRALRTRLPSLRSVVPSRHRNEMGGKAGYYGRAGTAASRLARESRIFREGARKSYANRKRLIYKYICRKMIYFAIKTA